MSPGGAHVLGSRPLTVADVAAFARGGGTVALSDAGRARIRASRAVVERHLARDTPVYGLNTGLGGNLGFRVPREQVDAFQTQIVRGRAIGVGAPLPLETCRAAHLCQITDLATGCAGVSLEPIELLIALFNRGVTPVLPSRGSISAGDIGLIAHMVAVLIGRGEAWVDGRRMPGDAALAAAGLAPATLSAKDGLGLICQESVSTGRAAMVLDALAGQLVAATAAAALALEGYAGNPRMLDARLHAGGPAGQEDAAAWLRAMLADSFLWRPEGPRRIQDATSFRTLAPIVGTLLDAVAGARRETERHINRSAATPHVLVEDDEILSSPNWHAPGFALAFDTLAIALTHAASAAALRLCKLMTGALSGLPPYLTPVGGGSAGYVSLQKTAAALFAEIRSRAAPVMLDSLAVSDTVEDVASFAFLAVQKVEEQLVPWRLLTAIEALAAAQAADLGGRQPLGRASAVLHARIRAAVPMLREDREPGADVMAVDRVLGDPATIDAIAAAAGGVPDASARSTARAAAKEPRQP